MKRFSTVFIMLSVFVLNAWAQAPGHWSFQGTVVHMQMTDCIGQRSFMASMSGVAQQAEQCPQYTVIGDKVVYVVVGRHAAEFIPLAETMQFLVRKNELLLFSDDEKSRSRFVIQQMTLRAEWEREETHRVMAKEAADAEANREVKPHVGMLSARR